LKEGGGPYKKDAGNTRHVARNEKMKDPRKPTTAHPKRRLDGLKRKGKKKKGVYFLLRNPREAEIKTIGRGGEEGDSSISVAKRKS